ncbi:PilZ domain-containing protein [Candidatus Entotheonella palauensis]|uniref:Uncharacterized protein n=1 Tax=Candidatus Entotheonella gemina TaxID=1429439 RepID=W4L9F6_9BACT|nr:PilZ domain-containing protein [Candidatus Entotheonella palauensis]ETW94728.1 MAG: hypothetical protein ETSY2_49295 [Candidatus Entotheonella gemina]
MTKTIHILIDDRSESSAITCPHCGRKKTIPNEQLCKSDRPLRVKCSCQNVFALVTNRRRFQRRDVNFTGDMMQCTSHKRLAVIDITSLSVEGIGFRAQDIELQVGDTFTVAFNLDDDSETTIVDEIVVCNINQGTVGAKFMARNGYNPEIDFYLMDEDCKGSFE